MIFFTLSSTLAPTSKRLRKDGDSGDWCLQVKEVSDSVAGGGKEIGRPWVGISFKLLTGLSQGNYGQLLEIGMQRYYKE